MAFSRSYIGRQSASLSHITVPQGYTYNGTTNGSNDSLATIKASAYFNEMISEFSVGDWIMINGNDGYDIVVVTSVTTNVAVTTVLGALPAGSVELADLASGISPQAVIKASDTVTTIGGGATEAFVDGSILLGDEVFVQMQTVGAAPVTVVSAIATAGGISVTFSGDPSNDHVIMYQAMRPAT